MLRGEFRKLTERIDSQLPDGTSRDVRDLIRAIVTKEVTKCCESISKQIGEKLACALSSAVALSLMGKRLIIPQFDRLPWLAVASRNPWGLKAAQLTTPVITVTDVVQFPYFVEPNVVSPLAAQIELCTMEAALVGRTGVTNCA